MQDTTRLSVFVTGGETDLGREVTRQLTGRGHQVTATVDGLENAAALRAVGGLPAYSDLTRAGEIASVLKMAGANVIINLAPQAVNGLPLGKIDWDYHTRVISEGAAALVKAAEQAGVGFIVHTSFTFLYGDAHGAEVDETAAIDTTNPLFAAAARAEQIILRGKVPACVLRAGFHYGPGAESILALRDILRAGRGVMLGDEHNTVSWIHSSDLAQAVILAAEKQIAGQIFNIADDHPASAGTFVDHFADLFGVARPGRQRLPSFISNALLNKTHLALLATSVKARNDKARTQLGWTPRFASHIQGIEHTLLAWRAREAPATIAPDTATTALTRTEAR